MSPDVQSFLDPVTQTLTHVVHAGRGGVAAIIDPVRDFDAATGRRGRHALDAVIAFVEGLDLTVAWILETHVHADHLSGAQALKERLGGRIGIGGRVAEVQRIFAPIFNAEPGFIPDGRQFDHLFANGESFAIGALEARVIDTPGHTPACVSYVVGDAVFVGDTVFMPDVGTARADFPGGDARTLYRSIRRILDLDPATRVLVCHDYPPAGREPRWQSTVQEQRRSNIHIHDGVDEEAFVAMRDARDRALKAPALLLPSVQVNMRAGALPPAEADGGRYLKIPVDRL